MVTIVLNNCFLILIVARYSVKVNIWGELTESLASLYEEGIMRPIIVILTSAKFSTYRGK